MYVFGSAAKKIDFNIIEFDIIYFDFNIIDFDFNVSLESKSHQKTNTQTFGFGLKLSEAG
jgi:hypothetical protein